MDRYPYRGGQCFLILKPYGQGWQIDIEIDGEIIEEIYTNSEASSKVQAVQESTRLANGITGFSPGAKIAGSRSRPFGHSTSQPG